MARDTSSKPAPQVTVSDKVQKQNQMRKSVEKSKNKDSNSGSGGLTENQRLAIYAALAGAAGSGVGAAIGGKNNRVAGALIGGLGAAAVTGLSKPVVDLISDSIKTVNPPPKHQLEGVGLPLAVSSSAMLPAVVLQSLKPSYNRLAAIARNWKPDDFKGNPLADTLFGGKYDKMKNAFGKGKPVVNRNGERLERLSDDGLKLRVRNTKTNKITEYYAGGLQRRIQDLADRSLHGSARGAFARSKELSRLLSEAQALGLLRKSNNSAGLGSIRNWLARSRNRRLAVAAAGLPAVATIGLVVRKKIMDNRERMKNGW